MAKTEEEKRLLRLIRDGVLLEKLLNLELSREEYRTLLKNKEAIKPSRLIERIEGLMTLTPSSNILDVGAPPRGRPESDFAIGKAGTGARLYNEALPGPNRNAMTSRFQECLRFYRLAQARENHFVEKTLATMKQENETKAILVTGGFHTDGLQAKLEKAGLSYITVSPRMSDLGAGEENYLRAMLEEYKLLENSQIGAIYRLLREAAQRAMGSDVVLRRAEIHAAISRVTGDSVTLPGRAELRKRTINIGQPRNVSSFLEKLRKISTFWSTSIPSRPATELLGGRLRQAISTFLNSKLANFKEGITTVGAYSILPAAMISTRLLGLEGSQPSARAISGGIVEMLAALSKAMGIRRSLSRLWSATSRIMMWVWSILKGIVTVLKGNGIILREFFDRAINHNRPLVFQGGPKNFIPVGAVGKETSREGGHRGLIGFLYPDQKPLPPLPESLANALNFFNPVRHIENISRRLEGVKPSLLPATPRAELRRGIEKVLSVAPFSGVAGSFHRLLEQWGLSAQAGRGVPRTSGREPMRRPIGIEWLEDRTLLGGVPIAQPGLPPIVDDSGMGGEIHVPSQGETFKAPSHPDFAAVFQPAGLSLQRSGSDVQEVRVFHSGTGREVGLVLVDHPRKLSFDVTPNRSNAPALAVLISDLPPAETEPNPPINTTRIEMVTLNLENGETRRIGIPEAEDVLAFRLITLPARDIARLLVRNAQGEERSVFIDLRTGEKLQAFEVSTHRDFAAVFQTAGYTIQRPGSDVKVIYVLKVEGTSAFGLPAVRRAGPVLVVDHPTSFDVTGNGRFAVVPFDLPDRKVEPLSPLAASRAGIVILNRRTQEVRTVGIPRAEDAFGLRLIDLGGKDVAQLIIRTPSDRKRVVFVELETGKLLRKLQFTKTEGLQAGNYLIQLGREGRATALLPGGRRIAFEGPIVAVPPGERPANPNLVEILRSHGAVFYGLPAFTISFADISDRLGIRQPVRIERFVELDIASQPASPTGRRAELRFQAREYLQRSGRADLPYVLDVARILAASVVFFPKLLKKDVVEYIERELGVRGEEFLKQITFEPEDIRAVQEQIEKAVGLEAFLRALMTTNTERAVNHRYISGSLSSEEVLDILNTTLPVLQAHTHKILVLGYGGEASEELKDWIEAYNKAQLRAGRKGGVYLFEGIPDELTFLSSILQRRYRAIAPQGSWNGNLANLYEARLKDLYDAESVVSQLNLLRTTQVFVSRDHSDSKVIPQLLAKRFLLERDIAQLTGMTPKGIVIADILFGYPYSGKPNAELLGKELDYLNPPRADGSNLSLSYDRSQLATVASIAQALIALRDIRTKA